MSDASYKRTKVESAIALTEFFFKSDSDSKINSNIFDDTDFRYVIHVRKTAVPDHTNEFHYSGSLCIFFCVQMFSIDTHTFCSI